MSGMGFRGPSGGIGGMGDLDFIPVSVKPVAMAEMDLMPRDQEREMHDKALADMTEEEIAEMEEDMAEEEADEEAERESDEEDQEEYERVEAEKKKRRGRYICYCGNPYCTIGFREGRQRRNDQTGIMDERGNILADDE